MADRIPQHHLVVIAAAAAAAVMQQNQDQPRVRPVKIKIRMPIVLRPPKASPKPEMPQPEKKEAQ